MQVSRRTHQKLLYIRDQRQLGKSDTDIRVVLLGEGYSAGDVDRLFETLDKAAAAQIQPTEGQELSEYEPPDNGLGSFGIGVGVVAAVTLITWVILRFTTDWSVVFWGLSIIGLFAMAKGIFFGLTFPDSGWAKTGRLALYVLGIGVVGVCAFWTWTTFYGSTPSEDDVDWKRSEARPVNDFLGRNAYQLTGTIGNKTDDWRLEKLELTVTPINASGNPMAGSTIKVGIVPQGVGPNATMTYAEKVTLPLHAEWIEEYLEWEWVKR